VDVGLKSGGCGDDSAARLMRLRELLEVSPIA
jgi:hypothetical protein